MVHGKARPVKMRGGTTGLSLPLVDADGMGRAFPEIQMVTFTSSRGGQHRYALRRGVADSPGPGAGRAGAEPGTVAIVELEEIPLAYLPSNAVRFKMKAVGKLKLKK